MVLARVSRTIDCTTASALRARWSTSRASSVWRSSASLRSVMSTVTPLTRTTLPSALSVMAAAQMHQRSSPFGRMMRASVWKVALSAMPSATRRFDALQVFRMDQRPDVGVGERKALRLDAEDAVLAVVPDAFAGLDVPVPRPHLPGGERQAAALLALPQTRGGRFELGGALRHAALEFGVELFELAGLAIELGEDLDLGAQHLRHDRHRHVIHRAHLVAAQAVDVGEMDGGDEDDRGLLEARMLADHRRQLEAVELRHADVDQHDRDVRLQQMFQRLAAGGGLDQILPELLQDDLIGEQLRRLIVDQQNVDLVVRSHERSSGSAMQPHAQRGQQLLGVDRLGEIIRRARLQAFLAVALHRLGGQRDDRQPAVGRDSRGSSPSSDSHPFPAS